MKELNIRCSSIGYIMTEPRSKSETLSETCKTHLIDVFVANKYSRNTDIFNKYVNKGLAVEEDGITLLSLHTKNFYKKNDKRLKNDWINGEPDLFDGLSIEEANTIIDIKCSWDLFTFSRSKYGSLNKHYWWQLQGYMALTGATKAQLCYCLVDTPLIMIMDEKKKLMWKMGAGTEEDENYIKACEEIDNSMIFDDISMNERIHIIDIERDDAAIESIYKKVKQCRDYYDAVFVNPLLDINNTESID
jgi:hypothetical protein